MKILARSLVAGSMLLLAAAELVPLFPLRAGLVGNAYAVVGAPMTPGSVAGVARRTTRRTVVATSAATSASAASAQASAASASAASAQASAASAQAASAQASAPAPAPAAGAPAVGTVVGKLPAGCVAAPVGGVEYQLCGGVYYRAAFQGNNLVYVVQKP